MRFFGTRVETELVDGRYFITSEKPPPPSARGYTIREVTEDAINTIGELCGYSSCAEARRGLKDVIGGNQTPSASGHHIPPVSAPSKAVNSRDDADYLLWRLTEEELTDQSAADIKTVIEETMPLAKKLHALHVKNCNRGLTAAEERRVGNMRERLTHLAESIGCGIEFNSDPRGAPVFLKVPSGVTDDWGQRGLVIPYREQDDG